MRYPRPSFVPATIKQEIFAHTICHLGWHTPRKWRLFKFNGGNGAWLCRNCRLILKYGHDK